MKLFERKQSATNFSEQSGRHGVRAADWRRLKISSTHRPQENHFETLMCLKYGRLYGVITPDAYESGKVDLRSRL